LVYLFEKDCPMKLNYLLYLFYIAFAFVSCKNDAKKTDLEIVTIETTQEKKLYTSSKIEAEFNDPKVAAVYNGYIELKTALVNTNSELAALACDKLMVAYTNSGNANEETAKAIEKIKNDTNVETQREAFVTVTNSVEEMLEGALKSGTIYKQFCPMAFNNTGGYWLSNSKDIQNPYFGDKMLKCGRVASEIK